MFVHAAVVTKFPATNSLGEAPRYSKSSRVSKSRRCWSKFALVPWPADIRQSRRRRPRPSHRRCRASPAFPDPPDRTTRVPVKASSKPIQNDFPGRFRRTSQLNSPTTIGELFPSSVAFAALVFRMDGCVIKRKIQCEKHAAQRNDPDGPSVQSRSLAVEQETRQQNHSRNEHPVKRRCRTGDVRPSHKNR